MGISMNMAVLIGNTCDKAEIRETPNGNKVATFSVATSKKWKTEAGEQKEQTQFHNIVAWNGLAEILEKYMKKGQKVSVKWEIQYRTWETDTGEKRYKTEILAEDVIIMSPGEKKNEPPLDDDDMPEFPKKETAKKKKGQDEIHIEDIPF